MLQMAAFSGIAIALHNFPEGPLELCAKTCPLLLRNRFRDERRNTFMYVYNMY